VNFFCNTFFAAQTEHMFHNNNIACHGLMMSIYPFLIK